MSAFLGLLLLAILITFLGDNPHWIFIIILVSVVVNKIYKKAKQELAKERNKELKAMSNKIDKEGLPVVETSLVLGAREKCHYHGSANRLITSKRVVGYSGGSKGYSVRIVKGVSVRQGTSKGTPIRGDVTDTYFGNIAITNKRIVFLSEKGFEFTYSQITALDNYSDAIAFQVGNNRYTISTSNLDYIKLILDRILKARSEGECINA